jgi:tryptophan halogenase
MNESSIKTVVIVGGGTSGWMAAAALAKVLRQKVAIRLVESDEIATIGVGEATIPMISLFNRALEIDEDEFLRETQGTIKLGVEFVNWWRTGHRYMHAFGRFGQDLGTLPFYQHWLRMYLAGKAPELENYSINRMASLQNKCMRATTEHGHSPLADIAHAFHFDAGLYARYLRRYAEARGVARTEGRIVDVALRAEGARAGDVEAVVLASGERVGGDLFLDCSGFRALLIEGALKTGFEDWSHWLPCNRAVAVPCESSPDFSPYTRSTAHTAGWQWRIPLQHRIGNGHVYCAEHLREDEAIATLMNHLDGRPLAEPRTLKFTTGKRRKAWNRNCVAIGLAGGFIEPLESTSIHMVQSTLSRLIALFPDRGFSQADIDEFNRQCDFEYERIRDFIVLHYKATERDDTPFWRQCRDMRIPESLQARIELYRSRGHIVRHDNELFAEVAWLQVLHGQGIRPERHHPLAELLSEEEAGSFLGHVQDVVRRCVDVMPTHAQFIARHCAAPRLQGAM